MKRNKRKNKYDFYILIYNIIKSSVGNGDTFDFVSLLDSVGTISTGGGSDEFVSEAFSEVLGLSHGGFTSTITHVEENLVDTTEWGDVDSLTTDLTTLTDSAGVFTNSGVLDTINEDLDWVSTSGKVDNLESSLNVAVSHELLTRVTTMHHECVD